MAVTAKFYGNAFVSAFNGLIDFDTDTIKVALASGYVPDQDTHDFFNDVTGELSSANGYTAGGATLAGASITYTAATNVLKLDGNDVQWTATAGQTLAATHAVIYKSTGTASTSPLIAYVDFGETISATGTTFDILWDAAGIATVTLA